MVLSHFYLDQIEKLKNDWIRISAAPEIELRNQISKSDVSLHKLNLLVAVGTGKEYLDQIRDQQKLIEKSLRKQNNTKDLITVIQLGKSVVDSETGQRGFLLTGKYEFLVPFHIGKSDFKNHIEILKVILIKKVIIIK